MTDNQTPAARIVGNEIFIGDVKLPPFADIKIEGVVRQRPTYDELNPVWHDEPADYEPYLVVANTLTVTFYVGDIVTGSEDPGSPSGFETFDSIPEYEARRRQLQR